jgi:periplasmic protein TonB
MSSDKNATRPHALSSDLVRMCLPSELTDSEHRYLAWVNSICLLFLLVGLVGLRTPLAVQRPANRPAEVVPVIFTPPAQPRAPEPVLASEAPAGQQEAPKPAPRVAPMVAAILPGQLAFPVPVAQAVAVAELARAAPPAAVASTAATGPSRLDPNAAGAESFCPAPQYPPFAVRNRYEGVVTIELHVNASGSVAEAHVQTSSGFNVLDDAALDVVRNRWHFPPGSDRWYFWPCEFRLK